MKIKESYLQLKIKIIHFQFKTLINKRNKLIINNKLTKMNLDNKIAINTKTLVINKILNNE